MPKFFSNFFSLRGTHCWNWVSSGFGRLLHSLEPRYYLHVHYLLRIQQFPVNNTYNTWTNPLPAARTSERKKIGGMVLQNRPYIKLLIDSPHPHFELKRLFDQFQTNKEKFLLSIRYVILNLIVFLLPMLNKNNQSLVPMKNIRF